MVQRRQGLRLHHPVRRQQGCLRASLRRPGFGLQEPDRGTAGEIRAGAGTEGSIGIERSAGLTSSTAKAAFETKTPREVGSFFLINWTQSALFIFKKKPPIGRLFNFRCSSNYCGLFTSINLHSPTPVLPVCSSTSCSFDPAYKTPILTSCHTK